MVVPTSVAMTTLRSSLVIAELRATAAVSTDMISPDMLLMPGRGATPGPLCDDVSTNLAGLSRPEAQDLRRNGGLRTVSGLDLRWPSRRLPAARRPQPVDQYIEHPDH